ncbi:hypothetical protein BD311DRAFT_866256 [Dichomitus squalens]|uniref:Ser-Thr-rich glycosyl-phosphatidyl-inositol-anchored membrane family-domain-containing protein n=1 Tax=Dichomitus squalens TaxID=114155 RepID=A0A4Q9MIB4_9APHY|nr:hypothetical protein BD311DRAFT_866256 [Dichomitus squalens]
MFPTAMHAMFFLLALAVTTLAKPLAFNPRDAISPPITNPTAQTVWKAGDTQTVTWDLSGLNGAQPSNPQAQIILGTFINGEEHLLLDTVLASGFNILDGNVTLTVPTVTTGSDYIVCLFGSSGDISPPFTIVGTDASSSSFAPTTQADAASSSRRLPPHQTTHPTTSVSLPPTVIQTTIPSSASSPLTTWSSTSIFFPSGTPSSAVSGSTQPTATATSPSNSTTGTSASSTSTITGAVGTGNSGARTTVAELHLWSAIVGTLAFWVLL